DPDYASAMATSAYYYAESRFQGWADQPEEASASAVKLAWRAVEIAKDDANVLWLSAFAVWVLTLDARRSRELFRRSLQLNPNSALALTRAGWVEAVNGNPEVARRMIERSLRLNPCHPRGWATFTGMAITYLVEKRFAEALEWAEQAVVRNRRSTVALRAL